MKQMKEFLPTRPHEQIAQRLRERRLMVGSKVTLRTIAAAIGQRSHTNLVRYESGRVVNYDAELLRRLARVYGCSVRDFYQPPGSPWTERKPPSRKAAPLRVHAPVKYLGFDMDLRYPMKLPPLTKALAEARAVRKCLPWSNKVKLVAGANYSGMSAILDVMKSGSFVIHSISIGTHGRA